MLRDFISWRAARLFALGAAVFWMPDVLWHAVAGPNFGGHGGVLWLTLIMPLTLLGTYVCLKNGVPEEQSRLVGWALMAGVWLLGGPLIILGNVLTGAGYSSLGSLRTSLEMLPLSCFPPVLWVIATYDGTLGALLIVSVFAVLILSGRSLRRRWRFRHSGAAGENSGLHSSP